MIKNYFKIAWRSLAKNKISAVINIGGLTIGIAVAMLIGLVLDFAGLNAVRMLFWSAVVNGLLAPPLVVLVVLLSSDRKVMGVHTNSRLANILGWACAAVMAIAGVAMFIT